MRPLADTDVVIVEAARSPLGRRNGGLATVHPADLLATVLGAVVERAGIDPAVGRPGGGRLRHPDRRADLQHHPHRVAARPGSRSAPRPPRWTPSAARRQQAANLAAALVGSGVVDVAMACGVESMSRIPLGVAVSNGPGRPLPKPYFDQYEYTTQFEAAERIADQWGITRADCDHFGLESQVRAARAWARGPVRA